MHVHFDFYPPCLLNRASTRIITAASLHCRYDSVQLGMLDLDSATTSIEAFAVDALAAAVIYNTYGSPFVRPSGTIADPIIYGFVLDEQTAHLPAELPGSVVNMTLAACMDTLIRAGPIHYSRLIYFRGLDTYLQFSVNQDLQDQEDQKLVAYNAMVKSAIGLPITALSFLALAYVADLFWKVKGRKHFGNVVDWFYKTTRNPTS